MGLKLTGTGKTVIVFKIECSRAKRIHVACNILERILDENRRTLQFDITFHYYHNLSPVRFKSILPYFCVFFVDIPVESFSLQHTFNGKHDLLDPCVCSFLCYLKQ